MPLRIAAFATCLATLFGASAAAALEPDPNGVWLRDDGNAHVRIARCGAALCATNVWIRDTSKGEEVGDVLVMKVSQGAGVLTGTAYDPKRKLSYSMKIAGSGDGLSTRGCIVGGLICKTVSWSRLR